MKEWVEERLFGTVLAMRVIIFREKTAGMIPLGSRDPGPNSTPKMLNYGWLAALSGEVTPMLRFRLGTPSFRINSLRAGTAFCTICCHFAN